MRRWDKEEKATELQQDTTRKDKSEVTGQIRKTKKIPWQDQTIQIKQDLPKQRKNILSASRGRKCEDSLETGCKGSKTISGQNMGTEGW